MHGWAEIEHKLAYKQEGEVPQEIRRKFCQLSALLEIADDLFESVREERERHVGPVKAKPHVVLEEGITEKLDIDTYRAIVDRFLPGMEQDDITDSNVLAELNKLDLDGKELTFEFGEFFEKCSAPLPKLMALIASSPMSPRVLPALLLATMNSQFLESVKKDMPALVPMTKAMRSVLQPSAPEAPDVANMDKTTNTSTKENDDEKGR